MTEWFNSIEHSFASDWRLAAPFTMIEAGRAMYAYQAVWLLAMRRVQGDIVEAGVYKGGMSMMMALATQRAGRNYSAYAPERSGAMHASGRTVWLFDTFTGLPLRPPPTAIMPSGHGRRCRTS